MNKINYLIIVACFAFMLSSCSSSLYYQICDVYSTNTPIQGDKYVYEDDNCKVTYDFWAENGDAGFVFTNKTDKIISLNLGKSFFVSNGIAYDYFLNRKWSSEEFKMETKYKSVKNKEVDLTNMSYSIAYENKLKGIQSKNIGESMSLGVKASIAYEEKDIILIPAKSSKIITEYSILSEPIRSCDIDLQPKVVRKPICDENNLVLGYKIIDEGNNSKEFDVDTSPIIINNIITYSLEGVDVDNVINNEFFIKRIRNKRDIDAVTIIELGCEGDTEKVMIMTDRKPISFYIKYLGGDKKH